MEVSPWRRCSGWVSRPIRSLFCFLQCMPTCGMAEEALQLFFQMRSADSSPMWSKQRGTRELFCEMQRGSPAHCGHLHDKGQYILHSVATFLVRQLLIRR